MLQPVVPGDKISARIADNRNTQAADLFHHISAETVRVCARRSRFVDPGVDGVTQMFEEGTEKTAVER